MGAAMRYVRAAGRRLAGSALARVNRCRVTATDDVPILAAQAHCHTSGSGRSRSVIKSEIAPAHKPVARRGSRIRPEAFRAAHMWLFCGPGDYRMSYLLRLALPNSAVFMIQGAAAACRRWPGVSPGLCR